MCLPPAARACVFSRLTQGRQAGRQAVAGINPLYPYSHQVKIAPESDPEAAQEVVQDVPIVMQSNGLTSPAATLAPAYGATLVAALAAAALVLLY